MTEHGGNVYKAEEELGIPRKRILDFSASINPLGIPKTVISDINKNLSSLVDYPDPDSRQLVSQLAENLNIDPASVLCGNGSTELIYLIVRALQPKKVLIPAPAFSEYERACKISNESRVMRYALKKEDNFDINPDEFISAMSGDINSSLPFDMVFLCNPNNPTGRLLEKSEVMKIANAAGKLKCFLVVDEAFMDFCPEDSVIHEVNNNPYLIVLRSMTKFYALAGLRIGYGIFPKKLVPVLKKYKETWTVNSVAGRAAAIALKDVLYRDKTFRLIKREKQFLEKGFRRLGIDFFPSDANFYLLKSQNTERIYSRLRAKGILVRGCADFRGLGRAYFRVAVRSRKENRALLEELEEILNKV